MFILYWRYGGMWRERKKEKMKRPTEIQRHLVCTARKITKAFPPVISLYFYQPASFHPLIISIFLTVLVPPLLHLALCLLPSLTVVLPLSPLFLTAYSQYFICPHFCSSLLSSFLSLSCLFSPLHLLSPLPHLTSSDFHPPHHLPCYIHTIYLSVTLVFFFFTPSTLVLSSVFLLPFLLPGVLWSQPGWRQLQQQTVGQWALAAGGRDGKRGYGDDEAVGLEGVVTFLLAGF